jgi:hypothetical protein
MDLLRKTNTHASMSGTMAGADYFDSHTACVIGINVLVAHGLNMQGSVLPQGNI